jgi:hypothetical protein
VTAVSVFKGSVNGVSQLVTSPEMQADMKRRAEQVKAEAEATAPVGRGPNAGQYKRSFSVSSGVRTGRAGTARSRRAFGRVTNDAPEAFFVEYGTVHNPRHRTLGRALDAAKD